jgi:predicted phosphodiesterase
MRYLILSDIHSNLEALQATLAAAQGEYEQVVCCGDLVGYGPNPDEVVDWVRQNTVSVVRGNHDKACSGVDNAEEFNEIAKVAAYWTRDHLKPENLEYLKNLPMGPRDVTDQFAILHGSPRNEDEYITASWEAAECVGLLQRPVNFFGHTHLQGGFLRTEVGGVQRLPLGVPLGKMVRRMELRPKLTYYLNPGSVGQPRDRDVRAAYALYDTDGVVEYRRILYDVEATIRKMQQAGLPEFLAHRLRLGR